MQSSENTTEMMQKLDEVYGEVKTFLNHETPFQLLVAVILSAQTTDVLINQVTPELFLAYPTPEALAKADLAMVEVLVRKVNYFKTKARHLVEMAQIVHETYHDQVPETIEDLVALPGVGRKVANVILADVYKKPLGVVVDTHVKRVSKRIGWTEASDPVKVEKDLMAVWPKERWVNTPKQIILIGRQYCFANRRPDCERCPLNKWCEKKI